MVYTRGQPSEYDDWARFTGYASWNWEALKPHFVRHETTIPPASMGLWDPDGHHAAFLREHHGGHGPIKTSSADWRAPVEEDWHAACRKLGVGSETASDARGLYTTLSTIDRSDGSGTRSYSTTAYLAASVSRPNLKICTSAVIEKVLLEKGDYAVTACGVAVVKESKKSIVWASREIILCAGALHTPQILELSGIGSRDILSAAAIPCIIENAAVGEHLKDHPRTGLSYNLVAGEFSIDNLAPSSSAALSDAAFTAATKEYASGLPGAFSNAISNTTFVSLAAAARPEELTHVLRVASSFAAKPTSPYALAVHTLLTARLRDPQAATLQLTFFPGSIDFSRFDDHAELLNPRVGLDSRVSVMVTLCHPFSSGSVHIVPSAGTGANSLSSCTRPLIDPGYLKHPVDIAVLTVGLRIANDILRTEPLASRLGTRVFPPSTLDIYNDHAGTETYIRGHCGSAYNPTGTAGLCQVVDERLKVRACKGLRVIDASVIPEMVSGGLQAAVYAMAEKGAAMIRDDRLAAAELLVARTLRKDGHEVRVVVRAAEVIKADGKKVGRKKSWWGRR